ncbi:hypothetical protein Lal_00003967 [Lupinus albus]|nr:hypothetical protein Lal_00003967 [Lupinus albus]
MDEVQELDSSISNSLTDSHVRNANRLHLKEDFSISQKSWKPRLIERFSPERERITWEGEILDYTGEFSPGREMAILGC